MTHAPSPAPADDTSNATSRDAKARIEAALRRYRGPIACDDPITKDPGVRLSFGEVRSFDANDARFTCEIIVEVHDDDTCIDTKAATANGRFDLGEARIIEVRVHCDVPNSAERRDRAIWR